MIDDPHRRLGDHEDNFTERKSGGVGSSELKKVAVAFANSVPSGRTAILYLGITDGGEVTGISNPDSLQKTVRKLLEQECYPSIEYQAQVLLVEGKSVLAVIVPPSTSKPHFAGLAYIRVGSESVVASEKLFQELVTARLSKCRDILAHKGRSVTVIALRKLGDPSNIHTFQYPQTLECEVEECTPHFVRLHVITTSQRVSEPLDDVTLSWDEERNRLLLTVGPRA